MPSKVCLAPNGGLASFHLAAAQGTMGASSGFAPYGSEESQVLILMPSGRGVQRPEKSGVWAVVLGGWGFPDPSWTTDWADRMDEEASNVTRAMVRTTKRFRILRLLDSVPTSRRGQQVGPTVLAAPALVLSIAEGSRRVFALT